MCYHEHQTPRVRKDGDVEWSGAKSKRSVRKCEVVVMRAREDEIEDVGGNSGDDSAKGMEGERERSKVEI